MDLYSGYEQFCHFNKIHPESMEKVGRILKKQPYNFVEGRESKGTKRRTIWKGVRLTKWVYQQKVLVSETFILN
jgi:hypothetical protein